MGILKLGLKIVGGVVGSVYAAGTVLSIIEAIKLNVGGKRKAKDKK